MHPWIEEFYPVEAQQAAGSDMEALQHSLLKWQGLRPENLAKHGVIRRPYTSLHASGSESELLCVDASSCALCKRYFVRCEPCPLYAANGGRTCADRGPLEDVSAWGAYVRHGNPEPMIALIERAIACQG